MRKQSRDDAVPILGSDLALRAHFHAQRVGDIHVEAFEVPIRVDGAEGRVRALGGDA